MPVEPGVLAFSGDESAGNSAFAVWRRSQTTVLCRGEARMGRFERDEIEARRLPTSLGSATDGLRSTIEAEVAKIVERAEDRAAEIESQALDRASRMQEDSE